MKSRQKKKLMEKWSFKTAKVTWREQRWLDNHPEFKNWLAGVWPPKVKEK